MPKQTKLKHKIILLFTVFTFTILSIVIIYFYFTNKKYIQEQSQFEIKSYSNQCFDAIQKEIEYSQFELNDLTSQLEFIVSESGGLYNDEVTNVFQKFIDSFPFKYSKVIVFNQNRKECIIGIPTRVFSGEILADISQADSSFQRKELLNLKEIMENNKSKNMVFNIDNKELNFLLKDSHKNNFVLLAKSNIDNFIEQALSKINFPNSISVFLASYDGVVLFATDKKLQNQQVNNIIPNGQYSINKFTANNENYFIDNNNSTINWKNFKALNLFLQIQNDYSNEINNLNTILLRVVGFTIFFIAIVLIVISYLSNRLSNSLNRVTNVANLVAAGDFSHKIEIVRNDEIGILINSFNEMVNKLKISYSELNELNIELENKINELIQTKAELSQKQRLALVGETISKISHEIQNKISGINIWVQNLEFQLKNDETSIIYLNEIKEALKSFQEKLVNFKKFYRQPQLNKQKIDLNPFVDNILDGYSLEISSKELTIKKCFCEMIPFICGDKEQLEEVFINLLLNALYFSPQKGIIEIQTFKNEKNISVSISDNGPGIKQDDLDKILQPFYTTKLSGSGLGLTIANNIITAHNGALKFFNKENGGACFEIILPFTDE
ncbi:MAG: ATP-binding protein [Ignavibacteriales bacterium]|nr:ATP-binding protein [Ignavibacteriales bacterium]